MVIERLLVDDAKFQRKLDAFQMSEWVHQLAPWELIAHFTFRWEAGYWSAQKCYRRYMKRDLAEVSYFYALEQNPSRDGYHVHALWADTYGVFRKTAWREWFERYGRARIEPVRSRDDVSAYCAKYVCKEGAWWDVRLGEQCFRAYMQRGDRRRAACQPGVRCGV